MSTRICMRPGCEWKGKPLLPFQIKDTYRKRPQGPGTICLKCHAADSRKRKPAIQTHGQRKDQHYGVAVNPIKSGPAPG